MTTELFLVLFVQVSLVSCSPSTFDEAVVPQALKYIEDRDTIRKMMSFFESTTQSLKLEIESLKTIMAKQRQNEIQSLKTSMAKQRQDEIESLKTSIANQRQNEIESLKTSMAKQRQDEIESLKTSIAKQRQNEIESLKTNMAQRQNEIHRLKTSMSALQHRHRQEIAKQRKEFQRELTAIRQLYKNRQDYKIRDPELVDSTTSKEVIRIDGGSEIVDDIKGSMPSEKKQNATIEINVNKKGQEVLHKKSISGKL